MRRVLEEIRGRSRCALFLDLDGTISPIVDRPDQVCISTDMRGVLNELIHHVRFSVSIVSGRTVEELRRLLGLEGLILAGVHGLHISYPEGDYINKGALHARPALDELKGRMEPLLSIPGVILEDKGLTVSFHYRMVSEENIPHVKKALDSLMEGIIGGGSLELVRGKMVYEFRPRVEWHKGRAVEQILEHLNRDTSIDHLPIYLGDDTTDEDAFAALAGRGITIRVDGEGVETSARFFISSVEETLTFLRHLAET